MSRRPKIESTEFSDLNEVASWYILLRWIACTGVFVTLVLAHVFLLPQRSFSLLYVLNAFLGLANLGYLLYFATVKERNLSRKELGTFLHVQVCGDYVLLLLFIYLTGFLENPFAYFFVFHIMLTSFLFPDRKVYAYSGTLVAVFCVIAAAQVWRLLPYYPLGLLENTQAYYDTIAIRLAGLSSTLVIVAYLITSIKNRIEERGRGVEIELNRYKDLDKVKSNFILQVTHEIRGPVAALKGYHEMMLKGITGSISERTEEALHRADVRTQNLLNIIDEMIDYAHMVSTEDVTFEGSEIDLRGAIAKSTELFAPQAAQRSITLTYSCPAGVTLLANVDLLDIILSNLLTNAIKYSDDGTAVSVTATQEDGMAHIQVKDQGIGIESDAMNMIFEEFYRSRRAREMERDGTGLGLSIVKKVVEFLNGRIAVYSEPMRGSNFHVFLPLQRKKETADVDDQGPDH